MDDLDGLLHRMRGEPVDARLVALGDAVMAGLEARRERAAARRAVALAAALALGVGVVGGTLPAAPARAVALGLSDLAPSRLLAE